MKKSRHVLIVDDENEMRAALTEALKREGHSTVTADNGQQALQKFGEESFDLVLSDVKMPKMTGEELLREIKSRSPGTPVIIMTAYGTIDSAVQSMKDGAFDYLLKPFSAEILSSSITRAFQSSRLPKRTPQKKAPKSSLENRPIITQNPTFQERLKFAENIAYSKSTVLISGETGTGKELFARYIHQCSPRANEPFLAVNCAALPEGLLESELFGYEKGAFTGALARKDGKFELASGGTLLLDEVTELSLPLQAKLLRVLQEHEVDKVGGREPIPVDVRVIATTNSDPKTLVEEKKFREDLYYRLNVIPIQLPPLRDRLEDIPLLAEHFLDKHSRENNKPITSIAKETLTLLSKYQWRGNVREFENILERAVLLCPGDTLLPAHLFLDDDRAAKDDGKPLGKFKGTIYDMERELIFQTLEELGGNKTRTAETLGISIRTLRNKLNPKEELFLRDKPRGKASVMLKIRAGKTLSESQIQGIVHLVASSVDKVAAKDVVLVDLKGNMLSGIQGISEVALMAGSNFKHQKRVEQGLESRITVMLEDALGIGKVIARVNAELNFDRIQRTEEVFDPDSQVVRSEQSQIESSVGSIPPGGVPGVQSHLPQAEGGQTGRSGTPPKQDNEKLTFNYEINKTVRNVQEATGEIQKLSVSVLIDGTLVGEPPQYLARTEQEMAQFLAIIKASIGFNEKRGDKVQLENVRFDKSMEMLRETEMERDQFFDWGTTVAGFIIGVILLMWFLLKILLPLVRWVTTSVEVVPAGVPTLSPDELLAAEEERQISRASQENLEIRKSVNDFVGTDPKYAAAILRRWLRERT